MSLFERMPNVVYNYTDQLLDPKVYTAKNLWRRNDIRDEYLSNVVLFDQFFVKPGDTPESISFNYYNRVDYGWTIMIVNDITNYHEDWPRTAQALKEYVFSKYDNPDAVMMYETTEVVDALQRKIVEAGKRVPSNFQVTYFNNIIFSKDCIAKLIAWRKRLSKGSRSVQVRILQTIGIIYPSGDKTIIRGNFVSVKESFN